LRWRVITLARRALKKAAWMSIVSCCRHPHKHRDYAGNIDSVSLHTFGSPRVGNSHFASDFDRTVRNAWRFTNAWDVVPT
jgi:hypothetical protein